jgi:hypothetical protein
MSLKMETDKVLKLKAEKKKALEKKPTREEFGGDEQGWWLKGGRTNFEFALNEWYRKNCVSKPLITELGSHEIFVFGSNLSGIHGAGAANTAFKRFGAKYGVGEGITGSSYALPTKNRELQTLPLDTIKTHVNKFFDLALPHKEYTFLVTEVGCGFAGYSHEDVAPFFERALGCDHIFLPESFWNVIVKDAE